MALILPLYFWFVTTGTGKFAPDIPDTISYNLLGDAFAHGQISLRIAPRSELLALPNPYDVEKQAKYALQDASLYHNRYYLYFGPFPGVVHAVFQTVTGHFLPTTIAAFLLGISGVLAFHCILWLVRKRAFPDLPIGGIYAVGLLYALGGTGLYLQSRPSIYHEAVLSGSSFLLWGICFWLLASGDSRQKVLWAIASGLCFAFAIGSRFNMVFYALAFGVAVLLLARRERSGESMPVFTAIAVPVAFTVGLLFAYNLLRFGSPLEFGGKYQMVCAIGAIQRLDPHLISQNVTAYFGTIPQFLPFYPFQQSQDIYVKSPEWFKEASFCSAFLIAPLLLFAPLPLFAALFRSTARKKAGPPEIPPFVASLTFGAAANLFLLLCLAWAAVRYMQDFLPASLLFGAMGFWQIERGTKSAPIMKRIVRVTMGLLVGLGIVFSGGLALSEINLHYADRTLKLAYFCDSMESAVLSSVAPRAWPKFYLAQAGANRAFADDIYLDSEQRPPAVFVMEGHAITLPVAGRSIDYLEADSLFDHPVRVQVEINGQNAGETTLNPGWQANKLSHSFRLPEGVTRVRVRVCFPDEPAQANGTLRPFRLRGI